ncbi:MAG TPA: outer membrane protein assembly factor BamD [Thermoanaerobaculia bacterium]|nr:outer membrane protein assembly factor BamD [Thermoanaerobaculia bacterium]
MRRAFLPLTAVALALVVASCRSGPKEDPILRLAAAESLAQGKELMAKKKYERARPYFSHAFEVEPNSAIGRESLLLAADTYYLEGSSANYVQAEAKYRDYLNRFPTSAQAPYVQFQIANSLAKRMEKPDRDQSGTRKAMEAYQELIRLYPTSEYAQQAQEQIKLVKANLAEHEFQIGRFYLRYGLPPAAVERFNFLLETYPEYPDKGKIYYHLGVAHVLMHQTEEARKAFDRLRTEAPDSPWISEIPAQKNGASK